MSGTTTLGFPYPELTDDPNGAAQIQALAEAVDANFLAPATPATTWGTAIVADVGPISGSSFTTIATLTVNTTGAQTLLGVAQLHVNNAGGAVCKWGIRVQDLDAGTATVWRTTNQKIDADGNNNLDIDEVNYTFLYTTPSGGSRTLRLQAGCDTAASVSVIAATGSFNSESTPYNTLSATVIK